MSGRLILGCSIVASVLALSGCLLDDVTVDENFNAAPGNGGSTGRGQVGSAQNTGGTTSGSAGTGLTAAAGTGGTTTPVVASGGSSGAAASEVNSNANTNTSIAPAASGGSSGAGAAGASGTAGASANAGGSSGSVTTAPASTVPLDAAYRPDRETACLDYCTLYTTVCAGHPANDYKDSLDCANFCIGSDWIVGDLASVVPGTVTCRYFHAGLAKDQGLTPHCYHAARVPTMGGCQVPTP